MREGPEPRELRPVPSRLAVCSRKPLAIILNHNMRPQSPLRDGGSAPGRIRSRASLTAA